MLLHLLLHGREQVLLLLNKQVLVVHLQAERITGGKMLLTVQ